MRSTLVALCVVMAMTAGAVAQNAAPAAGANSFTEAQARARIEMRGFSDVGSLVKNGDGVWQGSATKDGKSVHVNLDYRGDVTTN